MTDAALAGLTGLLHLTVAAIVVGPFAWWIARRRGVAVLAEGAGRTLALASGVYVGSHVLLSLPRVGPFADLAWNWQNKLLLLLALTLLVTASRDLTWRQVGLTVPRPGWWRPVLMIVASTVVLQAVIGPMGDLEPSPETVAFQALVPGLDEELLFRGVLLVLIDQALRARRRMWEGEIGWAVPITTLLFGLVHGLHVEAGLAVAFDPASIIATGIVGLLLVWVRVSTDSLWPAVLLHNAINSSVVVMVAVTQ